MELVGIPPIFVLGTCLAVAVAWDLMRGRLEKTLIVGTALLVLVIALGVRS